MGIADAPLAGPAQMDTRAVNIIAAGGQLSVDLEGVDFIGVLPLWLGIGTS